MILTNQRFYVADLTVLDPAAGLNETVVDLPPVQFPLHHRAAYIQGHV